MEKALNIEKETMEPKNELLSEELARELAIMALISAVKDKFDYASGPDFPNIPFGD